MPRAVPLAILLTFVSWSPAAAGWSIEDILSARDVTGSSLAVDAAGRPVAAYDGEALHLAA